MQILAFHGVGNPERSLDPGEEPYWLDEDRFLRTLDIIVAEAADTDVRLTFDDGNMSDYRIALPALLDRGLTAEFFVLSGRIGSLGSLGKSQIRGLAASGMVVGSHGVWHTDFTTLSPQRLTEELRRSKATLEDILGTEVSRLAIPFGRYNASVLRLIRQAGYRTVYSSDGGTADAGDFPMPRTSPTQAMSDDGVSDLILGRLPMWKVAGKEVSRLFKRLV